jgi:hypothetical protein
MTGHVLNIQHADVSPDQGTLLSADFLPLPERSLVTLSRYGWTPEGNDLYLLKVDAQGLTFLVELLTPEGTKVPTTMQEYRVLKQVD